MVPNITNLCIGIDRPHCRVCTPWASGLVSYVAVTELIKDGRNRGSSGVSELETSSPALSVDIGQTPLQVRDTRPLLGLDDSLGVPCLASFSR